ncbi:hypothetical protein P3X46_000185 [Hevea brasiliensis]|uniref:C3H1-type domain-containing protein n=1 Tax=Hevea brasiliensis TaxID=3981 RepID=A0ABQ9N8H4_HEVBR|nr:uncharacterized protein LOC110659942 isoform X2 [Hevea brasiliensis]KAJ9188824.1 hypothetical protein P3X46_000185 [Hevea brasiliensis]
MDALHSSKQMPKLKSSNGSVSPLNTLLNSDSTLIRYLCGGSRISSSACNATNDAFSSRAITANSSNFGRSLLPLSSVENVMSSPVYGTPVKVVDDEVLVMDEILVDSLSGGKVLRSLSSNSSDSPSNSSSSPQIRVYKTELCRSWEDFGHCRYGSKCQFVHGKEELRPTCYPMKNEAETHTFKSHSAASYSYGQKSRFLMAEAVVAASQTASVSKPDYKNKSPVITIQSVYFSKNTSPIITPMHCTKPEVYIKTPAASVKPQDWSPLDDDIEVALPGEIDKYSSPRKDVDAYIHSVLHGPRIRKRLPVFTEFCLQ